MMKTSTSRLLLTVSATACMIFASGCQYLRQDMANQPKNKALSPSDFFADGRSERPLLENTVAHGSIADDELYVRIRAFIYTRATRVWH